MFEFLDEPATILTTIGTLLTAIAVLFCARAISRTNGSLADAHRRITELENVIGGMMDVIAKNQPKNF